MPKIKISKTLNYLDALKFIVDNQIETNLFSLNNKEHYIKALQEELEGSFSVEQFTAKDDYFKIEAEIEVTINTELPNILCTGKDQYGNLMSAIRENRSVASIVNSSKYGKDKEAHYYYYDEETQELKYLFSRDYVLNKMNSSKRGS